MKLTLATTAAAVLAAATSSSFIQPVTASPFVKRAATYAGATSTDAYPPTGTSVGPSSIFPDESQIGYPGPTLTGAEPAAIETAPPLNGYPSNQNANSPLVAFASGNVTATSNGNFSIFKSWGNLSPWYTVPSSFYGLNSASPIVPNGCQIIQVHLLYRHGARYPTSGSAPSAFAAKVHNATMQGGYNATGGLSFLNNWTYKLGAELLTPFGRQQNFDLGVEYRSLYGSLLNNFTAAGTLPVFRTESQDRMVKTALNFMAGFFGIPEYTTEANLEIIVEAPGFNNTGAPYETCTNSNVASRGQLGNAAQASYYNTALASTAQRINSMLSGSLNVTASDTAAMMQLCAYETQALGYSSFCPLFTEQEFAIFEYGFDLSFYYNNGAGSPVAAAQGKGFLEEFVARLQMQALTEYNSTTNSTLDSSNVTFPLNQAIYADATHEVVVLDTLTAFNLSALFSSGPLPLTSMPANRSFVASQIVPFGTHFTIQVLSCPNMNPTKQIRFILNDAVLPIDQSYPGCQSNADGLCSFDTVLTALRARVKEIDFNFDCFANYNASVGHDYNGRAPRNSTM